MGVERLSSSARPPLARVLRSAELSDNVVRGGSSDPPLPWAEESNHELHVE